MLDAHFVCIKLAVQLRGTFSLSINADAESWGWEEAVAGQGEGQAVAKLVPSASS